MKNIYKPLLALIIISMIISLFSGCSEYDKNANIYFELYEIPKTVDPQTAESVSELIAVRNIYEGLVRKDDNGEIKPAVAESYTYSNMTYTFSLKENYAWSDGTPLTAHDFEFAFKRAVNPKTKAPFVSRLFSINNAKDIYNGNSSVESLSVKAIDDYTFSIQLSKDDKEFLSVLATSIAMPCNEKFFAESVGKYGLTAETTLSNGSYRLSRWDQENFKIKLSRNDMYQGDFVAKNGAVFLTRNEESDALTLLADDDVDASFIDCTLEEKANNLGLQTKSFQNICWVLTISDELPFNIRKSLALLSKSEAAISKLPYGYSVADSLFPSVYVNEKIRDEYTQYDFEKGKQLYFDAVKELKDKKFPSGVILSYYDDGNFKNFITSLAGHWQNNLGAYVNIEAIDSPAKLITQLTNQSKVMSILPVSTADNNLEDYLMKFGVYAQGNDNLTSVQNELIDSYNIVPLAFSNTTICYGNGVENLLFDAENGYIDFSHATKK